MRSDDRRTPRIVWKKREPGRIEFGLIYGSITILLLGAARFLPLPDILPACAFKTFTGIACPTCGTTRSLVHLAHGDFLGSFSLNPLASMAIIGCVAYFLYSLVVLLFGLPRPHRGQGKVDGSLFRIICALLALANWAYLIVSL